MNNFKLMSFAVLGLGVMAMGDVLAHVADQSNDHMMTLEAGALVLNGLVMVFVAVITAVRS